MQTIMIDGSMYQTPREMHLALKKMLSLPDYYGLNADALNDCLGEKTEKVSLWILDPGAGEVRLRRVGIGPAILREEHPMRLEARLSGIWRKPRPLRRERLVQLLARVHARDVPEQNERGVAVVHLVEIAVLRARPGHLRVDVLPFRETHPEPAHGELVLVRQHEEREVVALPLQLL